MNLKELKNKINKNVKGVKCDILSQSEIAKTDEWVETPPYDLNRILSGSLFKGLPGKTLTALVGPEASFKSSFMCLCMANAQKQGYTPIIIDTEGAWTDEFVTRWGLDPDNALIIYSPFVDPAIGTIGQLLSDVKEKKKKKKIKKADKKQEVDEKIEEKEPKYFVCVDSIGNLEDGKLQADIEKDGKAKADQGLLQKKIKRLLKLLLAVAKLKNSICVVAGHYYGSPSQYGAAEEIGGGYHMRLAPHIIISLKKYLILDENKDVIGTKIKAITLKNRFYPAFSECFVEIDYRNGVNRFAGMVDLAVEAELIKQSGAWYENVNTGVKFQGEKNAFKCIDEQMLINIDKYIQQTGYSTVNNEMETILKEADDVLKDD